MNKEVVTLQKNLIQLANIQMAYYDEGSLNDPVILLLHGFPDSAEVWRKMIPQLVNQNYRVIAPDLRGYGESEAPVGESNYQINKVSGDIINLINRLNINEKIDLVGHDWGAIIGWWLITFNESFFKSFTPISVGHPKAYLKGGVQQLTKSLYIGSFLIKGLPEKMLPYDDFKIIKKIGNNDSNLYQNWINNLNRPGRITSTVNLYRANLGRQKPLIKMPMKPSQIKIMGIYGKHDNFLSKNQMAASNLYTKGPFKYHLLDGGHWLEIEEPEEVSQLILNFIK